MSAIWSVIRHSLTALVGLPDEAPDSTTDNETDRFLASANERLASLESSPRSADAEADAEAEIASLKEALKVIPELRDQIRQIWSDGSYRFAGNEPY